ncbi:glycosyltransferase family 4 protein [Blastococcus sp. SYSU DS0828]
MTERSNFATFNVIHVGAVGAFPGGMAKVVNGMLTWQVPGVRMRALPTTRGKRRDPRSPFMSAVAAWTLVRERLRQQPTVVSAHLSERGSFVREGVVLMLARALGFGTVAHLHGADFDTFARSHPALTRVVLRRADVIAALTADSVTTCRQLLGPGSVVTLVRNGVSVPTLDWSTKESWVVFGGELSHRKGFDALTQAWLSAPTQDHWQLHIAGLDVEGLAIRLADRPDVVYHGPLRHEDLLALLERSKVAVLPSRAEALPMFLLEAMAAGNAVIGTRVGQVEELVTEEVGELLDAGDVDGLTRALTNLMDGESWRPRGERARARVRDHYAAVNTQVALTGLWTTAFHEARQRKRTRWSL